jgi:hypothetical protein
MSFMLSGFELCLPWKNTPATLHPDPADLSAPMIYKFSQYDGAGYDKSELITSKRARLSVAGSRWRDIC